MFQKKGERFQLQLSLEIIVKNGTGILPHPPAHQAGWMVNETPFNSCPIVNHSGDQFQHQITARL
jgi:hypothetical protein